MQRSLLLIALISIHLFTFCQNVGIGTNHTDVSSKLDIYATDKGLLIPRISLVQTSSNLPVTSPATSLLVYNLATINDVLPGFYYWNGTKWVRFANEPSTDWTLLGSSGTQSGTNFLGTKDSQDLDIRTNNIIKTRITTKGQIEILNTGSSVFVGENAGENDDLSANNNAFVGYQSGMANATGERNTAIGSLSLSANNLGTDNTAVGHTALSANTIGSSNIAIGQGALVTNVSGNYNTAIGNSALNLNTASNNIAIGRFSLNTNATGTQNIAIGNSALFANTTSDNIAIGHNSLGLNSIGNFNLGIGTSTLGVNVNGSGNLALGYNALSSNTASNNLAIGFRALDANTSGESNLAIGGDALGGNDNGSDNLAFGLNSLKVNTVSNNLAIGSRTLDANTTGTPNIAIGTDALGANITGNDNLAIGLNSLKVNTASTNLAIGSRTLDINTSGSSNLAIGADALGANITGSNNVALGSNSLLLNTASNNTAIGYTSGNTNTAGTNNTLIGYNSDVNSSNLTNATAIGANALVSVSNSLVLGNAANVGIGTSNPIYAKFQVVGNSVFSASTTAFGASTSAAYIRGNDGFSTSTNPDYTWYNNDQTGIFHPAPATIGFTTNGFGEAMRISNNRLGIGTTNPLGLLELSIDQGRKPGTGTWTITSDERLKNIEGIYNKGMKELMQLQPITYYYKNVGTRVFKEEVLNTKNVGFSAQNVQTVFPEAVGTDEDGYLNLNIHPILIAYLNAIKELNSTIEKLQAENNAVKSELEMMKKMQTDLDALKSQIQLLNSK